MELVSRLEAELKKREEQLDALRDSVLRAAFAGQLT
jgi:hypothetical protein